jgi:hypothetical protein
MLVFVVCKFGFSAECWGLAGLGSADSGACARLVAWLLGCLLACLLAWLLG